MPWVGISSTSQFPVVIALLVAVTFAHGQKVPGTLGRCVSSSALSTAFTSPISTSAGYGNISAFNVLQDFNDTTSIAKHMFVAYIGGNGSCEGVPWTLFHVSYVPGGEATPTKIRVFDFENVLGDHIDDISSSISEQPDTVTLADPVLLPRRTDIIVATGSIIVRLVPNNTQPSDGSVINYGVRTWWGDKSESGAVSGWRPRFTGPLQLIPGVAVSGYAWIAAGPKGGCIQGSRDDGRVMTVAGGICGVLRGGPPPDGFHSIELTLGPIIALVSPKKNMLLWIEQYSPQGTGSAAFDTFVLSRAYHNASASPIWGSVQTLMLSGGYRQLYPTPLDGIVLALPTSGLCVLQYLVIDPAYATPYVAGAMPPLLDVPHRAEFLPPNEQLKYAWNVTVDPVTPIAVPASLCEPSEGVGIGGAAVIGNGNLAVWMTAGLTIPGRQPVIEVGDCIPKALAEYVRSEFSIPPVANPYRHSFPYPEQLVTMIPTTTTAATTVAGNDLGAGNDTPKIEVSSSSGWDGQTGHGPPAKAPPPRKLESAHVILIVVVVIICLVVIGALVIFMTYRAHRKGRVAISKSNNSRRGLADAEFEVIEEQMEDKCSLPPGHQDNNGSAPNLGNLPPLRTTREEREGGTQPRLVPERQYTKPQEQYSKAPDSPMASPRRSESGTLGVEGVELEAKVVALRERIAVLQPEVEGGEQQIALQLQHGLVPLGD